MWGVLAGGSVAHQAGGIDVVEYPLNGYTESGVPIYGNPIHYGLPPELTDVRRIDVEGNSIYVSGFSASDTDDPNVWANWSTIGMTIIKFNSLPTAAGWPTPVWTTDPIYTLSLPYDYSNLFPEPFAMAVDPQANLIGVSFLYEQAPPFPDGTEVGTMGALKEYSASTGAYVRTLVPVLPGPYVTTGWLDGPTDLVSKNGWFWLQDNWYTRIIGICPSGACN
jgi:hypothetical protein